MFVLDQMASFYLCLALATSNMFGDFFNISCGDEREGMPVSPGRVQQRFPGLLTATVGSSPARRASVRTGHRDRKDSVGITS